MPKSWRSAVWVLLLAGVATFSVSAVAAPATADWTSPSGGSLNGNQFTTAGLGTDFLGITTSWVWDPLFKGFATSEQEFVTYGSDSDWSVTFGQAQTEVFLLLSSWRGDYYYGVTDVPSTYTFNVPVTIVSGLPGASTQGNTLTLPDQGALYYGMLRFSGRISTLQVDATVPYNFGQAFTLAANPGSTVPEPASLILTAGAFAVCALLRRLCALYSCAG